MLSQYHSKILAIGTIGILSISTASALAQTPPLPSTAEIKRQIESVKALADRPFNAKDYSNNEITINQIANLGEPIIPTLIQLLESIDSRYGAIKVLQKIGQPAIPALINALESDDYTDALDANYAIRCIEPIYTDAPIYTDDLLLLRKEDIKGIQCSLISALRGIGEPAIPAVLDALNSPKPQVRWTAAAVLGSYNNRDDENIISALLKVLHDPDVGVRSTALISFYTIIPDSYVKIESPSLKPLIKTGVSDLIAALNHSDPILRRYAAKTLAKIGAEATAAAPDLMVALNDSDETVRFNAQLTLLKIGKKTTIILPDLIALLQNQDAEVRWRVTFILRIIGRNAKRTNITTTQTIIPVLINALKDPDANVRAHAASALGDIGREAQVAVPNVITVLQEDKDAEVRRSAAWALGDMGADRAAIPILIAALNDPDAQTRRAIIASLEAISDETKSLNKIIVPVLITAITDEDLSVRNSATSVIMFKVTSWQKKTVTSVSEYLNQHMFSLEKKVENFQNLIQKFSQ